jgi:4-alpha-glucanotransferase
VGHRVRDEGVAADLVRLALSSVAGWAICPMQDILGLDGRARMNQPSSLNGNWTWRAAPPSPEVARNLSEQVALFGRKRLLPG